MEIANFIKLYKINFNQWTYALYCSELTELESIIFDDSLVYPFWNYRRDVMIMVCVSTLRISSIFHKNAELFTEQLSRA